MSSYNYNQDGGLETFMRSQVKSLAQRSDSTALKRVGVLVELAYGQKLPFRVTRKDLNSKCLSEDEISALENEGCLRHIDGGIYEILERAYDLVINKTVSPKAEGLVKMYEDQFLPRKKGVDDED